MRPGRRDVAALAVAGVIVGGTAYFILRIHAETDPEKQARIAGIVQGELAPVAIALVLLPLVVAWWVKGRRGTAPRLFFGRRYREYLQATTRDMDLRGLVAPPEVPVAMDAVFVDVSVARRPVRDVPRGVVHSGAPETQRRSIREFVGQPTPAVLALVGSPGTGKSTLLRHLARSMVGRRSVPILIELRRHSQDIIAEPRLPLWRLWQASVGSLAASEPNGWMRRRLERGRCLVLLDGLDEVPSPADDDTVRDWITDQIAHYPGNDFVVSSRPHDYAVAPIRSATTLEVRSLTGDQVRAFVGNMYRVLPSPHSDADDLLTRLHARPELAELATNPLLLTMIVLAHREGGTLPDNRAALYADVCAGVLARRSGSQRWGSDLAAAGKEKALAALAYSMTVAAAHEMPAREIGDPALDLVANGLLIETRRDRYAFAHRSFQEYFTARHIADNDLQAELASRVGETWWRETLLLYASGVEPDTVVRACLEAGDAASLGLATECAALGSRLDADLRVQLSAAVGAVLRQNTDSRHRGALIRALLHHEIGPLLPSAEGRRVGARPVSGLIYGLFLSDTKHPMPDRHPTAATPVAGLWPDDATAFTEWLSRTDGADGIRYAASTAADLRAVVQEFGGAALERFAEGHGVWATETVQHSEVRRWTPRGQPADPDLLQGKVTAYGKAAGDLAVELIILHAQGVGQALATVNWPLIGGEDGIVSRAVLHWYVDCLDSTLGVIAFVAPEVKGIPAATAAVRQFEKSLARSDLSSLKSALDALRTPGPQSMQLGQLAVDTTAMIERARTAYRQTRGLLRPLQGQPHLDRLATIRDDIPLWIQELPDLLVARWQTTRECHQSISSALGDAMGPVLAPASVPDRLSPTDADSLLMPLSEAAGSVTVALTDLPEILRTVEAHRSDIHQPVARRLVSRLQRLAEPIVTRREAATETRTARIRACAVAVAAQAREDNRTDLAAASLALARGVVLLQDRATGRSPSEVLFLTVS